MKAKPQVLFLSHGGGPMPLLGDEGHKEMVTCLQKIAGIPAKLDAHRGFDHGLFIPLKIMYPDAKIPCVQLSLVNNLSPVYHVNIGRALQDLNYENLLVIGSGFSFHNLQAFFLPETSESKAMNESFEA